MDVGGYRHNYEGFYEKSTYQMSINKERMATTEGAHASLFGNSLNFYELKNLL